MSNSSHVARRSGTPSIPLSCLALLPLLGAAAQSAPAPYVKQDTWQKTMFTSREALMRAQEEAKTKGDEPGTIDLGTWYSLGPFVAPKGKRAFLTVFPPEEKIDLKAKYEDGKLKWKKQKKYVDGKPHGLTAPSEGATYLYRVISAGEDREMPAWFGSDDALTVWLNGEKILANDCARGYGPNQDSAKLELKKGKNQLLLKISNRTGGHGFYFSTNAKPADLKQHQIEELWKQVRRDFPGDGREIAWEREDGIWNDDWEYGDVADLAQRYATHARGASFVKKTKALAADAKDLGGLHKVRQVYYRSRQVDDARQALGNLNLAALRRGIDDLIETHGDEYPQGEKHLARLTDLESAYEKAVAAVADGDAKADTTSVDRFVADFRSLQREALLSNPLLDFDRLLVVKRAASSPKLGLPQNWQGNCALPRSGYDDELCVLSSIAGEGELKTVLKPGKFIGDVDLHWDGKRVLFSSIGDSNRWRVFEANVDGTGLHQVKTIDEPDVDDYDPCYLPDGRLLFASTAPMAGVPCVGGGNQVANLYLKDPAKNSIRQLCFEQDHDWCPTVLNDGRVLYTRWEYTDAPHYFTRLLMHMNPDGTGQREYYGSNSFWPNSLFYARAIPNHPTAVVGVVSGHHGVARMGELVVLDPARGRHEADGVVQRIPGYGRPVEPKIVDQLVSASWPRFLHPYPLSDKYFLVSCQPDARSKWGIYLVDVFDNMTLLKELDGYALLEPLPLRRSTPPPIVRDKVDLSRKDAVVYMSDVYQGDGLKGVPRGTVKRLRIFEYHYGYQRIGGHNTVTVEGGWEPKRILGTVPVEPDGSAVFRVPANAPLSLQPLDAEGKALQTMRSWMTAMPGEKLTCIGCHEQQSDATPRARQLAALREPRDIEPWYGPPRGFSFVREVQPVLDKFCAGCHNGAKRDDGKRLPNFADSGRGVGGFTASYLALHPYVRRPGPESDYHLPCPLEYHADTSELVQMLQKGHHGVELDAEAWDRLITWIDLNVPDLGTWTEKYGDARVGHQRARRRELRTAYANAEEDPEAIPEAPQQKPEPVVPAAAPAQPVHPLTLAGWPLGVGDAGRVQAALASTGQRTVELADGVVMKLVLIPAGQFIMGSTDGSADEQPQTVVRVERPFWMGTCEVTNEQFGCFDPAHDSRYEDQQWKDHTTPGYPLNKPKQPVVRVSWDHASEFCRWLSEKTGQRFSLPTEAQWEYACRAGTATPFWFGDLGADYGNYANLADQTMVLYAVKGVNPKPVAERNILVDFVPRDDNSNDGAHVSVDVGSFAPNPWGLHDMHGNVAEWTRSAYAPYSSKGDQASGGTRKVVRGGSWRDRSYRATSSFRLSYPQWQRVFNVGFRVVCEADPGSGESLSVALGP